MMIEISGAKLIVALWGLGAAFLFTIIFTVWYLYFFRNDQFSKKLFYISAASLFALALAKLIIFYLHPYNYIADRMFFYAVPSPKALGWWWLIGVTLLFALFLYFREALGRFSTFKFLFALYVFFVLFSVGVAAIREGLFGIYEPFTRTHFEYTGNLYLVKSVPDFLKDYTSLIPRMAEHARTHPPGYTIILYIFQKYLGAGFLGMSILTLMLGGLTIVPLYYFLKIFSTADEVRRGLQIFVFLPSVVMMSATSMETTFLFFSWTAITLIYIGWQRSWLVSFWGGILAAASLFLNYLFLLIAPLFGILLFIAYSRAADIKKLILRTCFALLGFLFFYMVIYWWSGYSVIQNFFSARIANQAAVRSNFESFFLYFTYFVMSLAPFAIYLGIPNLYFLVSGFRSLWRKENIIYALGIIMAAFFLIIGVFQGETERLWIFLIPLFVLPLIKVLRERESFSLTALLSLLFFQIIFTQTLFYTYW